jgi:hypothetical protein
MGAVLTGAVMAYSAFAEPVKDADLRGKKICWNIGNIAAYKKDGSFDLNRFWARNLESVW